MKKNVLVPFGYILMGALVLTSCSGEEVKETPPTKEVVKEVNNQVYYQVPTPNELFMVIQSLNLSYNASLLNSPDNADKYTSKASQALNFGVYSADLALAASFKDATATISYFKAVRKMGESLNINNAFDETVFKRIEENINKGNLDSLTVLSNETYFDAYSYLEESDRGSTLSLIVVGGWVESLYLLSHSGEYKEGGDFAKRLGEQRLILENLLNFLMKYENDSDVMDIMGELAELDEFFMGLEMNDEGSVETVEAEGMYLLTGGADVIISKENYETLKKLVSDLRSAIVNGSL
jgi:hypothetical protein